MRGPFCLLTPCFWWPDLWIGLVIRYPNFPSWFSQLMQSSNACWKSSVCWLGWFTTLHSTQLLWLGIFMNPRYTKCYNKTCQQLWFVWLFPPNKMMNLWTWSDDENITHHGCFHMLLSTDWLIILLEQLIMDCWKIFCTSLNWLVDEKNLGSPWIVPKRLPLRKPSNLC